MPGGQDQERRTCPPKAGRLVTLVQHSQGFSTVELISSRNENAWECRTQFSVNRRGMISHSLQA